MNRMIAIAAAVVLASIATAKADISSSETECLKRQIEVKRAQDLLAQTSLELSRLSLEKFPDLKLGGEIGQNQKELSRSMSETRAILKKVCDHFFP